MHLSEPAEPRSAQRVRASASASRAKAVKVLKNEMDNRGVGCGLVWGSDLMRQFGVQQMGERVELLRATGPAGIWVSLIESQLANIIV